MSESNPAWHSFAALQSAVDPLTIDRSLARDEALDAVLADQLNDETVIQKRFYSLCRNRLSKQKYRRKLEAHRFRPAHKRGGSADGAVMLVPLEPNVIDHIAYQQLLDLILSVLSQDDLQLLLEMANEHSYAEMARARETTLSGIKARVFRVREKVRKSQISGTLRLWPRKGGKT